MLPTRVIQAVVRQVHQQFPELAGVEPHLRLQSIPGLAQTVKTNHYLFTFQSEITTSDGKKLTRWVRVVVNSQGEMLKVTTSH